MSCNRRKLKCDREASGCSNCVKSDVTCMQIRPQATTAVYSQSHQAYILRRNELLDANVDRTTRRKREESESSRPLGLKSLELTDSFGGQNISIPGSLEGISAGPVNQFGVDPAGAIAQWANAIHGLGSHTTTPNRSPEKRNVMQHVQQWPVLPPLVC